MPDGTKKYVGKIKLADNTVLYVKDIEARETLDNLGALAYEDSVSVDVEDLVGNVTTENINIVTGVTGGDLNTTSGNFNTDAMKAAATGTGVTNESRFYDVTLIDGNATEFIGSYFSLDLSNASTSAALKTAALGDLSVTSTSKTVVTNVAKYNATIESYITTQTTYEDAEGNGF